MTPIRAATVAATVLVSEYLVVTILFDATPKFAAALMVEPWAGFVVRCIVSRTARHRHSPVPGLIAPVCSGLDGLGLIAAFVAVHLATARDRIALPAGLMLLPIGIAAAWSANIFRIAGLVWIGSTWSAPLAAGGLHSKTGGLLFSAAGVVFFANRTALHIEGTGVSTMPSSRTPSRTPCSSCSAPPARASSRRRRTPMPARSLRSP